eukprot:3849684-Alexandrium_andersonii.AAC.1
MSGRTALKAARYAGCRVSGRPKRINILSAPNCEHVSRIARNKCEGADSHKSARSMYCDPGTVP